MDTTSRPTRLWRAAAVVGLLVIPFTWPLAVYFGVRWYRGDTLGTGSALLAFLYISALLLALLLAS